MCQGNKDQAAWRAFVRALPVAAPLLDADLDPAYRLNMTETTFWCSYPSNPIMRCG
jgi:hypothetical protein